MLTDLKEQPKDKILALVQMFRDDPREQKIDLGVGVYRNAEGLTPVMRAVKEAERRIWERQTTKAYTGLAGDPAFSDALTGMILGSTVEGARVAAAATPGGTGACRQGFDLVRMAAPGATVWHSDPTWPNHLSILKHMGMAHRAYRYFDEATRGLDFDGMMADLAGVKRGDVVLVHGCCHNPTGANPTLAQWRELAALLNRTGAVAMVDLAYQGFGDGVEEDAAATRLLASELPELIIAASCSKNFGIYRERTGLLIAIAADAATRERTQATLAYLNRQNYSFPPDHGARIVSTILGDEALSADWRAELEEVRLGMLALREQLAADLARRTNSDDFAFIAEHRGMFSRLGVPPETVLRLREEYGIYMVGDSRINIAGLNAATVPILADAIARTL